MRPGGQPYSNADAGSGTERAGCVVIVRPAVAAAAEQPAPATAAKAPATTPRAVVVASARKTPVPSARRVSAAPPPASAAKVYTAGGPCSWLARVADASWAACLAGCRCPKHTAGLAPPVVFGLLVHVSFLDLARILVEVMRWSC